jgi:hypothetical protein
MVATAVRASAVNTATAAETTTACSATAAEATTACSATVTTTVLRERGRGQANQG